MFLYCSMVLSLVFFHTFRYKKLEDLLEKSFSLVKMPSIQPVVMCVMKHLPKVGPLQWLAWCDVVCHWCDISGVPLAGALCTFCKCVVQCQGLTEDSILITQWTNSKSILHFHSQMRLFPNFLQSMQLLKKSSLLICEFFPQLIYKSLTSGR